VAHPSPDTTTSKRGRGPEDEDSDGGDGESLSSEVPACSVCEAPTDDECTDIDEEPCVNSYDRKREIQKKKRKTSKSTSGSAARTASSTSTKPKGELDSKPKGEHADEEDSQDAAAATLPAGPIEPDRILKFDDEKLVKLTAEDVVGVPEVWYRWLMRRPVGDRPEAWKVFIKTVTEFFKIDEEIKAGDRISGIDVAHAKRILKALESSMDPDGGADVRALQKRLEKSIGYFSGELFAFQTARQDGWKVARSAEELLKRTHTVPRARQQALARARKAEGTAAGAGKPATAATAAAKTPAKGGWAARRNAAKASKNAKGGTA
jgi:hypothetical protein